MSYQFIHLEDYSIEASTKKSEYNKESEGNNLRSIIAEAKREPGNIPSTVIEVKEPVLLYGEDLDTLEQMALNYHKNTKLKDKNGKEKKLRKDGPKRKRTSRKDYFKQKREIKALNELRKKTESELFLLKEKTDLEIQSLKKETEKDIKTIKENASALSRRAGRKEGFKSAILDFEKKNYFNKVIFSRTFSNDMIQNLKNENELLRDKNKRRL